MNDRLSVAIAMLAGIVMAAAASADAVVLWPVDPIIATGQQSAAVWIENRGAEPVTMQIRSLGWTQSDGEDAYQQQDAVVSSPPVARIEAGARQLVRIIRRGPDGTGEHAFRLLIDELPKPNGTGSGAMTASLAVQMRYSIPLFTYGGDGETAPALSIRAVLADGARYLEIHNGGGRHARLTDLRLIDRGQSTVVVPGLAGYVLAGATRRFKLPVNTPVVGRFVVGVNGADQTLSSAS